MQLAIDVTATRDATTIFKGFSLEMTAKDAPALRAAAPHIPKGTRVAVTFLPGEPFAARIAAAELADELGFEPIPHFSARRLHSSAEFEEYLAAVTSGANVKKCVVVAGDAATPEGPFADSGALIASGAFERHGVEAIGVAGHPDGHPNMTQAQCRTVLAAKCAEVERRGMLPFVVTQFAFDADRALAWLADLRAQGIRCPVRLGIPGPAGIKTLLRFAARCGVGASASVLTKYGISIGKLFGTAGPESLVGELQQRIGPEHEPVRLHFYPFGGLEKTVAWINEHRGVR